MTENDRQRAFDRFWQGPDAGVGRSGLGLSIVRQLVTRNGGSVELRQADPNGIDAVIVLPLTSADHSPAPPSSP
jgi:signal transduction histidine kinase